MNDFLKIFKVRLDDLLSKKILKVQKKLIEWHHIWLNWNKFDLVKLAYLKSDLLWFDSWRMMTSLQDYTARNCLKSIIHLSSKWIDNYENEKMQSCSVIYQPKDQSIVEEVTRTSSHDTHLWRVKKKHLF